MRGIAVIAFSLALPASARDLQIGLPIDCELGETCYIQQYVDRDQGPGKADFTCGSLTYDGHKGTDFALPTLEDMEAGVNVLAVAPGKVLRVRDGMPDGRATGPDDPSIQGKECGNGLVIDHGRGWETQYCHLRQGSVIAQEGIRVTMGQPIGQVGMSGLASFPHVHLTVSKDGQVIDPFDLSNAQSCGGETRPLWLEPVSYEAGGFLDSGIANAVPNFETLTTGAPDYDLRPNTPLVVWGMIFGGIEGDVVEISLKGPQDTIIFQDDVTLEKTQPMLFRANGRRAPPEGWVTGDYYGELRLLRDGVVIDTSETKHVVEP